jgi:hypothetical protein
VFSFIETKLYTRLVQECLTDDEYSELQWFLAADPESGPVIPGSGGVRKLRWRAPGQQESGQAGRLPRDLLFETGRRCDLATDLGDRAKPAIHDHLKTGHTELLGDRQE